MKCITEQEKEEIKYMMKEIENYYGTDVHIEVINYVKAQGALTELKRDYKIIHHLMDKDFGENDIFVQRIKMIQEELLEYINERIEDVKYKQKIDEIYKLRKALEELSKIEIIKTGKQVAKDNIKKQIVLINLFEQDEVLIDEYERLFGLNLDIMTEEEINSIELSVLEDGWW